MMADVNLRQFVAAKNIILVTPPNSPRETSAPTTPRSPRDKSEEVVTAFVTKIAREQKPD